MDMRSTTSRRWTSALREGNDVAVPQQSRTIAVLEGEGIGPEVMAATLVVLRAIEESDGLHFGITYGGAIGADAEATCGKPLPDEVRTICASVASSGGAVLSGPGGGRFVYDLRRELDLFCKISPITSFPELRDIGPFKPERLVGIDLLFVRENTSGIYQGTWNDIDTGELDPVARHQFSYSRSEVERILRVAAAIARLRGGRLTVLYKSGGLPSISALWEKTAGEVAEDMRVDHSMMNVDYAAFLLVHDPHRLDVIAAPNMMGDIVIDLAGALMGSRGLTFSGNFDGRGFGIYQTNHGAAFDLAGSDTANPCGQILSLAMLLRESFDLQSSAALIEESVREVWRGGWRTADVTEPGCRVIGTREMGERVSEAVVQSAKKLAAT